MYSPILDNETENGGICLKVVTIGILETSNIERLKTQGWTDVLEECDQYRNKLLKRCIDISSLVFSMFVYN
jgi:hypothetical protein